MRKTDSKHGRLKPQYPTHETLPHASSIYQLSSKARLLLVFNPRT